MSFAERAVNTCYRDWSSGVVVETHVRDVIKCRKVDVSVLEEFVAGGSSGEIRIAAARVAAEKGRLEPIIAVVLAEREREILFEMLRILGRSGAGLGALEGLVTSDDTMIRDEAVEMFRRTGNVDALFPLIFNEDDAVVQRIKRYINEAG